MKYILLILLFTGCTFPDEVKHFKLKIKEIAVQFCKGEHNIKEIHYYVSSKHSIIVCKNGKYINANLHTEIYP